MRNRDEKEFTLDDRPFKRDLETGSILRDPKTGEFIRMSREEYDDDIAAYRRKMRFAEKAAVSQSAP